MKKNYLMGVVMCLIAVLSWGGMFPIMGPALKIMDPFYFTLFRYGSVAIIFSILLLIFEGKQAFRPEGKSLKLWFLGTLAFAGFSFLVFLGQKIAGASGSLIASVMMAVQPLLGVLVAWKFRGVKPTVVSFISMIIAGIGVFMVVTKGNPSSLFKSSSSLLAAFFILLGALCWVIYSSGGAEFPSWSILRYSTLTTIYGIFSVIVILILATLLGFLSVPSVSQITGVSGALAYMISFAGVIAVFTWNMGNRLIDSINGILFMNLVPITSFVITIFMGYKISLFEMIGCILTICALVGNNLYNRYQLKLSKDN
ncbi:DMT family transporter [Streptococcus mutans]|uniref:DMT family transporter n=1 Tax=Streptococcus mutans TaxID=1309 RepID=UPI0004657634|nr:DMT family transporter [Streptococcus mutans]MCB5024806.1 DMT family transporter [Streptococcus mutans]